MTFSIGYYQGTTQNASSADLLLDTRARFVSQILHSYQNERWRYSVTLPSFIEVEASLTIIINKQKVLILKLVIR